MADTRCKNVNWNLIADANDRFNWEQVHAAILMDIRDELEGIRWLLNCHRVPRALDAIYELGVEARRRKRESAAKKRKAKVAK